MLLAVVRMDSNDNCNGHCLSKKVLDKEKGQGELKDVFVFSCCLILLLFFGLPFSMQVDWFMLLLPRAAITIVLKKRLVNSLIYIFYFVGSGSAAVAARQQR